MGETITSIEARGEVGCAYMDCSLLASCRRNKTVLIARVKAGEEGRLDKLVKTWAQQSEEACYREGNANYGRMVEIQHFPNVERRLIYQSN